MARKRKGDKVNGWVIFDKPLEMTSTQAVGKIRYLLNAQKAGHAGTLDPLATGVLPIALGEATKTIPYVQDALKTYTFTVTWGELRNTDDSEGEVIACSDNRPTQKEILDILPQFIGEIEQTPPQFSAIKINGERAYDIARAGGHAEIKSRIITVKSLELTDAHQDTASFRVHCGKGTYVRSLARDIAHVLGTYGYVSALCRENVGDFKREDAISLDFLESLEQSARRIEAMTPLESALDDIPALSLKEGEVAKIKNGNVLAFISKPDFERLKALEFDINHQNTALACFQGTPLALVEIDKANVKPVRVFNL